MENQNVKVPLRVLLVEDSEDDALLLETFLTDAGYAPRIKRVETAERMQHALREHDWDVVIADYHLPHFDAPAALAILQRCGLDLPFIIVSGEVGEDAAVAAMKAGAHDYIMKSNLARLAPAIERERREAEERRRRRQAERARARLAAILEASPDSVAITDLDGRYLYLNRAGRQLLGLGPDDDLAGRRLLDHVPAWARAILLNEAIPTVQREGVWHGETAVIGPGGHEVPLSQVIILQHEGERQTAQLATISRDISERRRVEQELERLALYDPLTGLPNRTLLHDRLRHAIAAAGRASGTFALLFADLDRFKDINDTLGHRAGDHLLQQAGERLRQAVRAADTVARLGGDEFAVLLPAAGTPELAIAAARRILQSLEAPLSIEGQTAEVRASIGIALFPQHGGDDETLLRHADIAMYVAKRAGAGYVLYSPEQDPYSPGRLLLVRELRRAIEQGELVLHFQPKVSCRTGEVVCVEALVRWNHPKHGLVPPDQFIPLAEQSGLIIPLSRWVLSAALEQAQRWRLAGIDLPVAVNFSMLNLHDPQLAATITDLMQRWELTPASLRAEITESAVMVHPARTIEVLTHLRMLGVELAIDDFGTGYSSLVYLKRLPVHLLKIDKSFVREMTRSEYDATIVRSTIDLAHNLALTVVAEGVEDELTWRTLIELGCDEGQGYFLSRPLPAGELARWLETSPWRPRRHASEERPRHPAGWLAQ